ncbi:stage III sporulation protein AF [Paenibacillus athensensis]|nr:stage III sporulation protein AF [Paenibacillus athensensis]MCD1260680.1 stage III sporulation protein AF [Paenibacillus athensensis]
MEWLGGWLRNIVLVIMLATFVDMLLPSSAMQRYVKTVMSLFILLTLLSPVIQLLQHGWSVDSLLAAAERKQEPAAGSGAQGAAGSGKGAPLPSLAEIQRAADRLKAEGAKQSQQLVETQLAAMIKDDLQAQTSLGVASVQASVQLAGDGTPSVAAVRVVLRDPPDGGGSAGAADGAAPASGGGTASAARTAAAPQAPPPSHRVDIAAMEPVRPIEPVRIGQAGGASAGAASSGSGSAGAADAAAAASGASLTPQQQAERRKLAERLEVQWQVAAAKIDIRIERGASRW